MPTWVIVILVIVIVIVVIGLVVTLIISRRPSYDQVCSELKRKMRRLHRRYDPDRDTANYIDIPVYYINLKRSPERNEAMIERFNQYGVTNYMRIEGVNGDDDPSIRYRNDFLFSMMTSGEIGCTLSHLRAIKTAYDNGLQHVLIMEDDTGFDLVPLWNQSLSQLIQRAGKGWRVLQLYSNYDYRKISNSNFHLFSTDRDRRGCVAYIINRDGMRAVLDQAWDKDRFVLSSQYGKSGEADIYIYSLVGYDQRYLTSLPLFIPFNIGATSTFHSHHDIDHMKQTIVCLDAYLG